MESCKTWNKEMSREFSLYKRVMWPLGLWPLDRSQNFAKVRALFTTITQIIMVIFIISMDIGFHNRTTLDTFIDHFVLASCGILTIIKIALIRLNRDNLLKNLYNAASDWTYIAEQNHRQVMLRYTNLGRFVFFSQMCFSYVVTMPLIVGPLQSLATLTSLQNVTNIKFVEETHTMELPHEMICPFDAPTVCWCIYILQTVQLISTATGNVGSDVFLFGVCMHLCGQLEVLGLEVLRFHEGKKNGYSNRTKMITLVERHCLLLNLAEDIVDILDIILIAQLVLHASLICVIGLQLIVSLAIHDIILIVRSILSFIILMIQLFLYSYMGETLSSKTQAISQAVYLSKWYNLPINIMRDLYFIIARANVPVRIKVGKFYNVDLNSFKNILKASVSYFSVLQIIFIQ